METDKNEEDQITNRMDDTTKINSVGELIGFCLNSWSFDLWLIITIGAVMEQLY